MKELTKAEEQVMQILWDIEKGFVKDVLAKMEEPKPAYNTVSTIIRILEKKGFVGYKAYGKTHEYYPIVKQEDYSANFFKGFFARFFNNSSARFTSFFAKDNELSVDELEKMKQIIEQQIAAKKQEKK